MKRRDFVKLAGMGAVVASTGLPIKARAQGQSQTPPSDRIGFGVIGPGSRGQEDMRQFLRMPGVEVRAVCDVYEPRFDAVRRITNNPNIPTYRDYRQLLDRKDLDFVVVATPPHLHAEIEIAALQSGRHVYGEKVLAFTVEQCHNLVKTVAQTGKIFQVGYQYRYDRVYTEAIRRIKAGEIGRVSHVFSYWHRNNNWRRPVPDPKFERLINWRMYKESSLGLMAELGSHHLNIINWLFDAVPESVVGSGGIDTYRDGRETNDNVQAIFRYPGGRTYTFSSFLDNAKIGHQLNIYGDKGTVEITPDSTYFYYEPAKSAPPDTGETVVDRGARTSATQSSKGDLPYRGPGTQLKLAEGENIAPNTIAMRSFIESLRNNKRPLTDVQAGRDSAIGILLANKAIDEGRRIHFAEYLGKKE